MTAWEVLLTNGEVHVITSVEPAVGEQVVMFWTDQNELVAGYILRNLFGWRRQTDDLGRWPVL